MCINAHWIWLRNCNNNTVDSEYWTPLVWALCPVLWDFSVYWKSGNLKSRMMNIWFIEAKMYGFEWNLWIPSVLRDSVFWEFSFLRLDCINTFKTTKESIFWTTLCKLFLRHLKPKHSKMGSYNECLYYPGFCVPSTLVSPVVEPLNSCCAAYLWTMDRCRRYSRRTFRPSYNSARKNIAKHAPTISERR